MSSAAALQQKKLTDEAAQKLFIEHFPLSFSIDPKFDTDHMMVGNLSSKSSIEQAVERYTRARKANKKPAMMSSWIVISPDTVKNKASGAPKRAMVYKNAQQMAIQIKVKRRTVELDELNERERRQVRNPIEVEINPREKVYLSAGSKEADVDLLVIGEWAPLTGKVSMYHYQEGRLASVKLEMLDRYLMWHYNPDAKTVTTPVATR